MKISIIIPIYKVEKYIERCLLSVLNQTYQDIELILVNDCTPDNSMEIANRILETHGKKEKAIVINHEKNRGISAARNSGIESASGDYFFFLDSDDEISHDAIASLSSAASSSNCEIIIGNFQVFGAKKSQFPELKLKDNSRYYNEQIMQTFLSKKWYEMPWNKLLKREIFTEKKCLFKEGIVHEDTLWSFQLALCASSMIAIQKTTYFYHIQNQSITQDKRKRNLDCLFIVLKEMIGISEKENLFSKFPSLVNYLDNLRIFFAKSLIFINFEPSYVKEQIKNVDDLFIHTVRKKKSKSIKIILKDLIISLLIKVKYRI